MRIFDQKNDRALKDVILLLSKEEAKQLVFSLKDIIINNDSNKHVHVNDIDYLHEITMCLYDIKKLDSLSDRIKKVVLEDK